MVISDYMKNAYLVFDSYFPKISEHILFPSVIMAFWGIPCNEKSKNDLPSFFQSIIYPISHH